jgi:hypothetical protein
VFRLKGFDEDGFDEDELDEGPAADSTERSDEFLWAGLSDTRCSRCVRTVGGMPSSVNSFELVRETFSL